MGKSPFEFNAEKMEFRRRDRGLPWEGKGSMPSKEGLAPPDPVDPDLENLTVASLVEKPEGYVDPTPTRRRRRSRSAVKEKAAAQKSSGWRGAMWGLILIMAVFWAYMLFTQAKEKVDRLEGEDIPNLLSREDVIPDK